jgi:hypothetical protein
MKKHEKIKKLKKNLKIKKLTKKLQKLHIKNNLARGI